MSFLQSREVSQSNLIALFGLDLRVTCRLLKFSPRLWQVRRQLFKSMYQYGVDTLPLTLIISLFIGAVTTWQTHYQFQGHIPDYYLGSAVFKALGIEVVPVLVALIVAGRNGAAIAAEVASMKLTRQLDALSVMRIPPLLFVGLPRFWALLIVMPGILTFALVMAMFGGYIIATWILGVSAASFLVEIPSHFHLLDLFAGYLKSAFFAGLIGVVSISSGLAAQPNSAGVGNAAVRSFVASSFYLLVANFITAVVLF